MVQPDDVQMLPGLREFLGQYYVLFRRADLPLVYRISVSSRSKFFDLP
ncbi:hypothetical protein A33Q_3245 [Indibacter alkaliphilus LW1]|uniref:Uncharacterized protein n=1 Tax=Indibacter alkaliphilus (strain CCUG 57479 / KCTC 22604 / LW1) TaxID=1189612 RepID=S2DE93_INDAL|nr:hypothetical protein A33Q_3245 [Indibacter alkaliphilus LW1]